MSLVDDDRVVLAQGPVALHLVEQDAVRHDLDEGVVTALVGEADLVADRGAELTSSSSAMRSAIDRRRCAGQGTMRASVPRPSSAGRSWAAGSSARARLAGHDDDLVVADRGRDVVLALDDRKVLRVVQLGDRDGPTRRGAATAGRAAAVGCRWSFPARAAAAPGPARAAAAPCPAQPGACRVCGSGRGCPAWTAPAPGRLLLGGLGVDMAISIRRRCRRPVVPRRAQAAGRSSLNGMPRAL